MTLTEIKQAIQDNKTVYWANSNYQVIKDNIGQYLIKCTLNGHCIGLTWQDGLRTDVEEKEFFTDGK